MFSLRVPKPQPKEVTPARSKRGSVDLPAVHSSLVRTSAAAPRLSWDFRDIPVFPPNQTAFAGSTGEVSAGSQSVREIAKRGTGGGGGPLPHLARIQRSFGRHDISHVVAHQDAQAAAAARAIGARAFAIGNRIAFASPPDIQTAAHEAAHVVQQRGGVQLKGDVGTVGDAYERHADAVAAQVVLGRPAEGLLDSMAPAGGGATGVQREVVQRAAIPTNYGAFDTTKYDTQGPAGSEYGVDIELTFDPDRKKVDAKKIGLTQAVRSQLAGKAVAIHPTFQSRMVPSGTGEGIQIDRSAAGAYGNPLYAADAPGAGDKLGDTPTVAGWGQHGWNYKDGTGALQHQIAKLNDQPTLPERGNNAGQTFETAALAVEGAQAGMYMGSVSWGWNVDGAGKFSKLPLTLKSKGDPSAGFNAAAKQWNKTKTAGTIKTTQDPTDVFDASFAVAFSVAKGTKVMVVNLGPIHNDVVYDDVRIVDGPKAGQTGYIRVTDLKDTGGGESVIPLPTR